MIGGGESDMLLPVVISRPPHACPRPAPAPLPAALPVARPLARAPGRRRVAATPPVGCRFDAVVAQIVAQPRSSASRIAKRVVDVIVSAIALVALSPLLVVLALAVKLTSRGPSLFVQDRCGLGGRRFRFYKLRTMVSNAEDCKAALVHLNEMTGPVFKIRRDPRITAIGRVLRKLSLDELPQLWNVLRGDMSLVGPRPPTPDEVARYTPRHAQRLSVMPGITGLWQVSGRNDIRDFERWIDLDLEYARTWSV